MGRTPAFGWAAFWPRAYRLLRLLDPVIRPAWRRFGIGNTVELVVPGRRTGHPRAVFLGLLTVGDRTYLGHPSRPCAWTRNVAAAGAAEVRFHDGGSWDVRAEPLEHGPERDAVVRATFRQHPFPGGVVYWLARGHVRAEGPFFRITRRPSAR